MMSFKVYEDSISFGRHNLFLAHHNHQQANKKIEPLSIPCLIKSYKLSSWKNKGSEKSIDFQKRLVNSIYLRQCRVVSAF